MVKGGTTVKCQNLCHLNLPLCHLILSFYFKLSAIFNPLCSLASHCCLCLATPLPSCNATVISVSKHTPHSHSNLPTKSLQIAPFSTSSHFTCLLHTTFLSAHPSFHFALQLFPSTFFTLCLLITQIKTLPPSLKLSSHLQQL